MKFYEYFENWIKAYKVGAIREVTMRKYVQALKHIKLLEPDLEVEDVNRMAYQRLMNEYAETHERQTVMELHHIIKASVLDAVEEG